MAIPKANSIQGSNSAAAPSSGGDTAEILYQRLGDKWYAFSLVEDEVFVGSISAEQVIDGSVREIKAFKITGNS